MEGRGPPPPLVFPSLPYLVRLVQVLVGAVFQDGRAGGQAGHQCGRGQGWVRGGRPPLGSRRRRRRRCVTALGQGRVPGLARQAQRQVCPGRHHPVIVLVQAVEEGDPVVEVALERGMERAGEREGVGEGRLFFRSAPMPPPFSCLPFRTPRQSRPRRPPAPRPGRPPPGRRRRGRRRAAKGDGGRGRVSFMVSALGACRRGREQVRAHVAAPAVRGDAAHRREGAYQWHICARSPSHTPTHRLHATLRLGPH